MIGLTYKLLSEFLLIFKYDGEIKVYWNDKYFQTISESSEIKDLENLPEGLSVEKDFYVQLPGEEEMKFEKALEILNFQESLKIF
jgi:hypothetical protein